MHSLRQPNATLGELSIPADNLFNVRDFGATGEGKALDTRAINRAITEATKAGGGTVWFPPGVYSSYSIRMQSHVRLYLDEGAVILAAEPPPHATATEGYDPAEDSIAAKFPYQDFGHSHFHNSLIWGENLRNIAIEGPGRIWGKGLVNGDYEPGHLPAMQPGVGNKAIALLGCENVILRDFSILEAGHFAVLATGTNRLKIEDVRIDTNRDGLNLDCCRDVRILRCKINSPNDDAICLKSSYALGKAVPAEDILIKDCLLTGGYFPGAVMDGSYRRLGNDARTIAEHYNCRLKAGTESNGGFRNVVMVNNELAGCRGVAFMTVDGGNVENLVIQGLTMRDVRAAPFFFRLGARLRGPQGAVPGFMRDISIRDVYCEQSYTSDPLIFSGIPGHAIENVELNHIHMKTKGGGTAQMAALVPPEAVDSYPEPAGHVKCFGNALPASGLFIRHIRRFDLRNFTLESMRPDKRPVIWAQDVDGGYFGIKRAKGIDAPLFKAYDAVRNIRSVSRNEGPASPSHLPHGSRLPLIRNRPRTP